jgi:hypothetical protein
MFQVFVNVFLKVFQLQNEACGYAKEKYCKKWASVQDIESNRYSDARHEKKKKKKIAHVL